MLLLLLLLLLLLSQHLPPPTKMSSAALQLGGGLPSLLKEGTKHYAGLEQVILKNAEAVAELGAITRTSLGPNGMSKLVVNHLDRVFVTSDAATIMAEMEIIHPAAKMVALAAKEQQKEHGDGTNLVVTLASELLLKAKDLLQMGLHPADIVAGYKTAAKAAAAELPKLVVETVDKLDNRDAVARAVRPVISTKFYGYESLLANLVADACAYAVAKSPQEGKYSLNVDNVRIAKIPSGSVFDSAVVKGMVLRRPPMGTITSKAKAGVAVFGINIEAAQTETKGTVLLSNAEELLNYTGTEEDRLEEQIRGVKESGADVVVAGGTVSEMALHFMERYGLLCVKITSKWELQRICRTTGAFPAMRLGPLTPDELGNCDVVETREIGGEKCVVFEQHKEDSKVATVVLRSSTENQLDDLERAVDNGTNTVKTLCSDGRLLAGAGACELELALVVAELGQRTKGLEQYPITKFAEALEVVPRTLAENAGLEPNEVVSRLYAAHKAGNKLAGVDVDHDLTGSRVLTDVVAKGIVDSFACKHMALTLAADVAVTILSVDQLIMSKQAGGPKLPEQGPRDAS